MLAALARSDGRACRGWRLVRQLRGSLAHRRRRSGPVDCGAQAGAARISGVACCDGLSGILKDSYGILTAGGFIRMGIVTATDRTERMEFRLNDLPYMSDDVDSALNLSLVNSSLAIVSTTTGVLEDDLTIPCAPPGSGPSAIGLTSQLSMPRPAVTRAQWRVTYTAQDMGGTPPRRLARICRERTYAHDRYNRSPVPAIAVEGVRRRGARPGSSRRTARRP